MLQYIDTYRLTISHFIVIFLHACREELLIFIKHKAVIDADLVVLKDGTTMAQVLASCGIHR